MHKYSKLILLSASIVDDYVIYKLFRKHQSAMRWCCMLIDFICSVVTINRSSNRQLEMESLLLPNGK